MPDTIGATSTRSGVMPVRCLTVSRMALMAAISASPSRTFSATPPASVLCGMSADRTFTATG